MRSADLKSFLALGVDGRCFVSVTHVPAGRHRVASLIENESVTTASLRLESEIEHELRAAGQHQYLEPGDLWAVVCAISRLLGEGCPVVGDATETALVAIRRWRSSSQRGVAPDNARARVRDLARGLILRFESEPKIVGPLWSKYEPLSAAIDSILVEYQSELPPNPPVDANARDAPTRADNPGARAGDRAR